MSLYTTAQSETGFTFATNLDSSSTEKANASSITVSSAQYGTVTQNANSLTGNASYDFGSNGRVLHQWGGGFGIAELVHEIVFKRDSNPASQVTLFTSLNQSTLNLNTDGTISAYVQSSSGNNTITSSVDICDGKFHHVLISYMAGVTDGFRLYVDGTLVQAKATVGNLNYSGFVNLGSYCSTSGTTPSAYSEATIDFYAFYRPSLSNAQVDTFVANHMATFADRTVTDTPATASALAVDPAISTEIIILETPATASALATDTQVSNFDIPTMLNGYLAGRSLEQWYEFDEIGKITNYGSGGNAETAWAFNGDIVNIPQGGIQGSGALKMKGEIGTTAQLAFGVNEPYSTEITDNEFSIAFWFKAESGFGAKDFNIVNYQELFSNNNYLINVTSQGYIRFVMNHNGTAHIANSLTNGTTNWCDGNWHFIQARRSASDQRLKLTIDNGTEISTTTSGGSPSVGAAQFGLTNTTGTNNKYGYVSHYFVTGYNSITSTERAAIITAAAIPIQATAAMVQPVVRFENAYHELLATYSPKIAFRLNEASGTPINFGSGGTLSVGKNGSNITYLQPTQNTYAYKFTNKDTYIQGDYSYPSGTFSSGNKQTMSAVFKAESTVNFEQIIGSMGMYGFIGSGITLTIDATNGYLKARINQGFGPTDTDSLSTTINVCDNKYHHAVGVRDGSSFKLYLDGKEVATMSSAGTTLSDTATYGISAESKFNTQSSAAKALHIDEFAVLSSSLSAAQVFGLYQSLANATEWTASALAVDPAVATGFGPIIAEPAMTASAELPNVFPFIPPLVAESLFLNPNYEAIKNVSELADPMTADAMGEDPGWDIGENNQVLHMDASASFPDPRVLIPGFWNASPAIANPAEMVEPAISSTLGALVIAQSIPVQAIFVSPPAYKLITDDIWYQKLYLQHSVVNGERFKTDNLPSTTGSPSASAFLKLFDDVTSDIGGANTNTIINNLPRSIVLDDPRDTSTATQYANAANQFLTATPTPVLETGTFDDYERKAVRFRNIQFEIPENNFVSNNGYSLEFTFKSTKSNQVIAQGFQQSFLAYQRATSSIGLIDGKLYATRVTQPIGGATIFAHPDNIKLVSHPDFLITAYGNKAIADGAWHHVIVQYGFDGRVQFWIDGELDIQFFADSKFARGAGIRPYIIGSNQSNPRWQSDFETSAWSYDAAFFVDSDDITQHYTASIKYEPVKAEPATATAEMGQGSKGEGNRPRALMLYFWPTAAEQTGTPFGTGPYTSTESSDELTTLDYFTKPPQEYEGWDVFPVDITGRWVSDLVKVEAYGAENIGRTNFITNVGPFQNTTNAPVALFNTRGTFRDPLTDAPRYIDLIEDIDLSKFDMIFFKNYPNDPNEKDAFSGSEVVDAYFNLRESFIFEEFVKSLRAAVDTGISLMVANAQLALDLKIVDRVEVVPDMDDNVGQGNYSDPYAPTQMTDSSAAGLPVPPLYREPLGWEDTWKNNRTRIVNTYPNITDYPALVKTQQAFWKSTDEFRWGGADRIFVRYEHKNALAVGDEFIISTTGVNGNNNRSGYLATPFENVKAGKIITAFANTVRRGLDEIENPYRNYAQSIILEPGDVLNGTQVGGKIYVNFTEEINKCQETGSIELISDYWVNYAYENGAIDVDTRDELLAAEYNQDTTPYWSLDGMHLLQQASSEFELDTDLTRKGVQKDAVKTRKVNKNGGISFREVPAGSVFFSSTYSWQYPMANFEVPSMPTRGFRWLSNREVLEGTVIRPQAFAAAAEMPNAAAVPDRLVDFSAQSMVASALIEETQFSSGERKVIALPMTANATIVKPGSTIGAPPMLANAGMFANSRAKVASEDQVVLQVIHVDPILYIREDVIK